MDIKAELSALSDEEYRKFHSRLLPGTEHILGVRVPELRKLAKRLVREEGLSCLERLTDDTYEELQLQGLVIGGLREDLETKLSRIGSFVRKIDNWAVCDCLSPKAFVRHKPELLENIREWAKSEHVYTCRFGLEMLMTHFLDDDFKPEYLELAADVKLEDYYAKMMVAWFFATALAKQWDAAIVYLQQNRLEPWTHNKTIQKARESYRITAGQKEYLKTLKRTPSVTTSSCHLPRRGRQ